MLNFLLCFLWGNTGVLRVSFSNAKMMNSLFESDNPKETKLQNLKAICTICRKFTSENVTWCLLE